MRCTVKEGFSSRMPTHARGSSQAQVWGGAVAAGGVASICCRWSAQVMILSATKLCGFFLCQSGSAACVSTLPPYLRLIQRGVMLVTRCQCHAVPLIHCAGVLVALAVLGTLPCMHAIACLLRLILLHQQQVYTTRLTDQAL